MKIVNNSCPSPCHFSRYTLAIRSASPWRKMIWMARLCHELVPPAVMGQVLGIVYRPIATHQVKKAGYTHRTASTGAVTLIQGFGSALILNFYFLSMSCMWL